MITPNLVKVGIVLLVLSGLSNQLMGHTEVTGAHIPDEFNTEEKVTSKDNSGVQRLLLEEQKTNVLLLLDVLKFSESLCFHYHQ